MLLLIVLGTVSGYFYFKSKFQPPPNQLSLPAGSWTIPFQWKSDSINETLNPHAALLVPVNITGCNRTFFMQFDTGAPYSMFYGNTLRAIKEKYNNITIEEAEKQQVLKNYSFNISNLEVQAKNIKLIKHGVPEINWMDSTEVVIIGSIGTDIMENRILIIDYPGQSMLLTDYLPDSLSSSITFSSLDFESRRILLSSQGKKLLFDSGSSAFELLTSKSNWNKLRSTDDVQSFPVNSWGKTLTAHNAKTTSSLMFGKANIPITTVTYIEGTSMIQNLLMTFSGMEGMIGNKPFIRYTILFDFRENRFGVIQ